MLKKSRNYQEDYETFWKEIIQNKDGSLNIDQIKKELSDYSLLITNLSDLYCLATGDKVSYTTTLAQEVYYLFQEELEDAYNNGYSDGLNDSDLSNDYK
jgi:hypothetical protein